MDNELSLTGPYRGISLEYGCFAIKIDIPTTSKGSSNDDANAPIQWEYAAQVDALEPAKQIIHKRTEDSLSDTAEVTYAVMSNALEATVEVRLIKSGLLVCTVKSRVFGEGSVLFDRTRHMTVPCSSTNSQLMILKLSRNVVAVPCALPETASSPCA